MLKGESARFSIVAREEATRGAAVAEQARARVLRKGSSIVCRKEEIV